MTNWEVLGHLCYGMKEHQDYATYDCIPRIDEYGNLVGCDDSNCVKIKYCPYCGVLLQNDVSINKSI